ncbi:MAG: hypothetical protein ACHQAQ_10640, partial [Hyphomicrobiales bacterium]
QQGSPMMLPQWLEITFCICAGSALGAVGLIFWVKLGKTVVAKTLSVFERSVVRHRAPIA